MTPASSATDVRGSVGPLDYERLINWPIPDVRQTCGAPQHILYALSLNIGCHPIDARQLQYVYERDLRALPTISTVLAHPGFWMKEEGTGIDWTNVLHVEQSMIVHRPLPISADIVSRTSIEEVVDKGIKGAFVYTKRELCLDNGEPLCTLRQTNVCRSNGGFGGPRRSTASQWRLPERSPDAVYEHKSLPQQALLYRLNGDWNPLHADPDIGRAAGFPRPILHGLCTYGMAAFALTAALCGFRPESLKRFDTRFSAPVFPGETLQFSFWELGSGRAHFRGTAVERKLVVLDQGYAEYDVVA